MYHPFRLSAFIFCLSLAAPALAAETQTLYLSGKGNSDPVKWNFTCNAGMNANKPSTIGVPSNWELQGFGIYSYGTDKNPANAWPKVQGRYSRTFTLPDDWKNLTTNIVFEGVMTDATVTVNGQSAGPTHQGGYFRFKYDISKLLKPGENTLEVTVDDESADPSVNKAERRGDYWNYAGIFRPVYLEAVATQHIERTAISAQADGTFNLDAYIINDTNKSQPLFCRAQILDLAGNPVGKPMTAKVTGDLISLTTKIANPKTWNAETPNLYQVQIDLGGGETQLDTVIHSIRQKFGFRTIEAKPNEGLLLNGQRIILKGADRHCFWPDSGRTLSEQISRDDIALMKQMNMNTVRCSHYPPDQHFLDACDELGLYVLDELPGWHQHYDDPIGHKLVEEMVTRDINHPSILFWDNGNEGGWNTNLNDDFAKFDPQKRNVLHPWELFRGIDTKHYPDYNTFLQKANGTNVFFPTEFLHGLYDGGAGAGLDDYWKVVYKSKSAAGGIIWALLDEDVKRTDKNGKLDSNGNQAPDGILGPYREKEGSFYAIKQLWSPVVCTDTKWPADGTIHVDNRYSFTDLKDCTFKWETRHYAFPTGVAPDAPAAADNLNAYPLHSVIDLGTATATASIPPGTSGTLTFKFNTPMNPANVQFDAFALTIKDPNGKEIFTKVWPTENISRYRSVIDGGTPAKVTAAETPTALTVTAADLSLSFSKKTGFLTSLTRAGKTLPLTNGPRLLAIAPTPPAAGRNQPAPPPTVPIPDSPLSTLTQKSDGNDILVTATYFADVAIPAGRLKTVTTLLRPNGWATIDYSFTLTGTYEYFGVGFDLPDTAVKSMRYLGNGPATVYQNRLAGGTLDVWEKKANTTIDGDPDTLAPGAHFDYPVFKGFYAGVRWLTLQTTSAPLTVLLNQDDLFVQLGTPNLPPQNIQMNTTIPYPKAGLAFLHAIPAMGSKFAKAPTTGPQGQPIQASPNDYKGSISLYFGNLP